MPGDDRDNYQIGSWATHRDVWHPGRNRLRHWFQPGFIQAKGGESCIISVLAEEVDLPDGLPAGALGQPPNAGQSMTHRIARLGASSPRRVFYCQVVIKGSNCRSG